MPQDRRDLRVIYDIQIEEMYSSNDGRSMEMSVCMIIDEAVNSIRFHITDTQTERKNAPAEPAGHSAADTHYSRRKEYEKETRSSSSVYCDGFQSDRLR